MNCYNYTKSIKSDLLQKEIIAAGLTDVVYIETVGNDVKIFFNNLLNEDQEILLSNIVSAHSSVPPMIEYIKNRILAAMEFGKNIMAEYGASNVIRGLTIEQVQDVMVRTERLQKALITGSLYVAIDEINAIETDEEIITPDRVTEFRNKIETYLGIPLT